MALETLNGVKEITIKPAKSWWSGDSRVEKYMTEVSKVLDSVDMNQADRTSIYNRSYEAVYRAIVDCDKGPSKA